MRSSQLDGLAGCEGRDTVGNTFDLRRLVCELKLEGQLDRTGGVWRLQRPCRQQRAKRGSGRRRRERQRQDDGEPGRNRRRTKSFEQMRGGGGGEGAVVGGRGEEIYIKIARLYPVCPQRRRGKKKIERENSRRGDSTVRQWTAPGGGGVTERRRCSQQENREGEKREGGGGVCRVLPCRWVLRPHHVSHVSPGCEARTCTKIGSKNDTKQKNRGLENIRLLLPSLRLHLHERRMETAKL